MKLGLPGLLKTLVVFFVFLVAFSGCESEVSDGDDYSEKRITITYVDESGNILKTDSQTSYGSVWLSYIKTGYVCTYYDSNGKKIETEYNYKTESDCKIIVKFTPIKYTIKFEKKSSYSVSVEGTLPDSIECVYDTEYVLPKNEMTCTRSSIEYKPRGWTKKYSGDYSGLVGEFSDSEKVKNLTTVDGQTVTLYACFSNEDRYALTFYKDDSAYDYLSTTALVYADKDEIIGKDKVPEAKSKTGYNFDGYYLSTDESKSIIDFDTYKVTGDATFKPSYSYATYTATFVSEYGTAPEPLSWTYSPSYYPDYTDISTGIYKLSTTGYDFAGWYEENAWFGTNKIYHNESADMTLTAKWVPWTAKLLYNTNLPSDVSGNSSINSANITYGKEINIAEGNLYVSGYSFLGWNTKADGTGISYSPGAAFTWKGSEKGECISLYAQWKQLQTKMNIGLENAYDNADIAISYDVDSQCLKAAFIINDERIVPASCTWYIDGKKVEYETSSALSVYAFTEGIHTVMVTVDYSGRTYGVTITVNATIEE